MPLESNDKTLRESYVVNPIGYIKSKYHHFDDVPHAHGKNGWGEDTTEIIFYPEHAAGLEGLKGYSHHKPPGVKVFATRMPVRPNPIALSVVELVNFSPENGEVLVKGLDALDGTPILDIKPYIADFDSYPEATLPKWVEKALEHHHAHENH
jgi:tRNA (Thr-GGU) A37 N-methylase